MTPKPRSIKVAWKKEYFKKIQVYDLIFGFTWLSNETCSKKWKLNHLSRFFFLSKKKDFEHTN